MSFNLVHILLLGKPVSTAKPWLQGVIAEMVERRKPIQGDLDLFSVQDYPCGYGPCPVACNVIKFSMCSYMSNSLFAPILSADSIFLAIILCTLCHVKLLLSYCTFVVCQTVLSTLGYKLLMFKKKKKKKKKTWGLFPSDIQQVALPEISCPALAFISQ